MSACSLQHIFEKSVPENPTLSWKPMKHSSSFTEIFGELHFNESPQPSPSSSPHVSSSSSSSFSDIINHANLVQNDNINQTPSPPITPNANRNKSSDSFSSLSSENLQICTENLGFESSDEVEELKMKEQKGEEEKNWACDGKRLWKSRSSREREYPPPISCIGRSGRPCVSFMSYRNNGRFVLKEIRIPTHDFLHARREDGRLKLHFVQPAPEEEEDFLEEEEGKDNHEEEEEEEDYDGLESTDEGEENHGNVTDEARKENRD